MVFKVDYDKVSDVGNALLTKSEELNSLYLEVIDICKEINECWIGEDSSIYLGHMAVYLRDKIKENEMLHNTGKALKKVSSLYSDQDSKWANDLLKTELIKKENERK